MRSAILAAAEWVPDDIYVVASAIAQTEFLMDPFDFVIGNGQLPTLLSCDVSEVVPYATRGNTRIEALSLPSCTHVMSYAFANCTSLSSVYLPECERVDTYAFDECVSLRDIDLGKCRTVGAGAFYDCWRLNTLWLPSCTEIGSKAFYKCAGLRLLDLVGVTSVPSLGSTDAFYSTPMAYSADAGVIRVPASLYSAFRSAPVWSQYSSRITSGAI